MIGDYHNIGRIGGNVNQEPLGVDFHTVHIENVQAVNEVLNIDIHHSSKVYKRDCCTEENKYGENCDGLCVEKSVKEVVSFFSKPRFLINVHFTFHMSKPW